MTNAKKTVVFLRMGSFSYTSFRFIQFEILFPQFDCRSTQVLWASTISANGKKERSLCATCVSDIIYQATTHSMCCLCKSIFIILSIYLYLYIHIYPMLFACIQSDQMEQREKKVATLAQCKHKPKFNFHFISFLVWVHRLPLPLPLLMPPHFSSFFSFLSVHSLSKL